MKNKVENTLQKEFPFLKGKKLLVTVSGGIDSVILTHLLYQLDFNISIAHCNFCLRETESDKDAQFVENLANALNVPFFITSFNTNDYACKKKLSIQEAARNLRYKWFTELKNQHNLDYIITGHNLNDSLETFLINLSRGTGLKGLTGIPTIQNKIIRPLSSFTRDEIYSFAIANNIQWREDISNTNTKYTRNKIRHQIIPILQELNPNLLESFKQTLGNLQGSVSIIKDRLDDISIKKNHSENTYNIHQLEKKIQTNPKAYIHELFFSYGFTNTKDIITLLSAQSGKQVFSKTHRLIKDRENLILVKRKCSQIKTSNSSRKEISMKDGVYKFRNLTLHAEKTKEKTIRSVPNIKYIELDYSKLNYPLTVRKWKNGDYFYPIGMQGKKKLSKYFKDEKMSLIEKENIWLLLSDNNIVWVIGKRQDDRFKLINNTTDIIKITIL